MYFLSEWPPAIQADAASSKVERSTPFAAAPFNVPLVCTLPNDSRRHDGTLEGPLYQSASHRKLPLFWMASQYLPCDGLLGVLHFIVPRTGIPVSRELNL